MHILDIVLIVIIALIIVAYFYYEIKTKGLRTTVIKLIVEAENSFQKGMNAEKFSYVVSIIRGFVPKPLLFIFTEENIKKFVQNIFNEVKVALDYKKDN